MSALTVTPQALQAMLALLEQLGLAKTDQVQETGVVVGVGDVKVVGIGKDEQVKEVESVVEEKTAGVIEGIHDEEKKDSGKVVQESAGSSGGGVSDTSFFVGSVKVQGSGSQGGRGVEVSGTEASGFEAMIERSDTSDSSSSWADVVQQEVDDNAVGSSQEHRVSVTGIASCKGSVSTPDGVSYGGPVDSLGCFVPGTKGFFGSYVRIPRVQALVRMLQEVIGTTIPKKAWEELALASHVSAAVPDAFSGGQARLRGLSCVGDAAFALVLIDDMVARGEPVASVQSIKAKVLSNSTMSAAIMGSKLHMHVVTTSGIDMGKSKVGADVVEAIGGVLHRWKGDVAVKRYMQWLQLLD